MTTKKHIRTTKRKRNLQENGKTATNTKMTKNGYKATSKRHKMVTYRHQTNAMARENGIGMAYVLRNL